MATIKRKKKYLKKQAPVETLETFEIEKNPPPFVSRWNPERVAILSKVDATLKSVKPGEAFIIRTDQRNTIQKHLRDSYPNDRFSFQLIHDNPDKSRVYRLAYPKK